MFKKESITESFGRGFRLYCARGEMFLDYTSIPTESNIIPNVHLSILTHSEILFIPQEAILTLYQKHPQVWKDFGRWYKLRVQLRDLVRRRRMMKSSPPL